MRGAFKRWGRNNCTFVFVWTPWEQDNQASKPRLLVRMRGDLTCLHGLKAERIAATIAVVVVTVPALSSIVMWVHYLYIVYFSTYVGWLIIKLTNYNRLLFVYAPGTKRQPLMILKNILTASKADQKPSISLQGLLTCCQQKLKPWMRSDQVQTKEWAERIKIYWNG